MTRMLSAAALALSLALPVAAGEPRALMEGYFRFLLGQQIAAQADGLAAGHDEAAQGQVREAAGDFRAALTDKARDGLTRAFGDGARVRLESFVAEFTAAENGRDAGYLARLCAESGLNPPAADYPSLHGAARAAWLRADVDAGAAFLAEVQTWLEVRQREPSAPALSAWLGRGAPPAPAMVASPNRAVPAPEKRRNPLAEAEAAARDFDAASAEPAAGPLDDFGRLRGERRAQAAAEAQAGMQQVAAERESAEKEYAAKKTAAAQAEAEAVRKQADRLAAAEQDALEQRKNSWGNRLKTIAASTVGAATGAFTGGIGAEAGERAADALFSND